MAAQCEQYVKKHDVVLSPLEFERDHSIQPETLFPQISRRKQAMMLHDNFQHLHFVRHLPTGIRIAFCYKSRLVKAKADRLLSLLKARLPSNYTYIKLLKSPRHIIQSPELSPFYDYLPGFLEAGPGEAKRTKANKESFSSFFLLFTTSTSTSTSTSSPPAVASTSPPSTPASPSSWISSRSSSPGDEDFGSFDWQQQQQQQEQQELSEAEDVTQESSQLEPIDFISQESSDALLDFEFDSESEEHRQSQTLEEMVDSWIVD